jgi:hypothetical protein
LAGSSACSACAAFSRACSPGQYLDRCGGASPGSCAVCPAGTYTSTPGILNSLTTAPCSESLNVTCYPSNNLNLIWTYCLAALLGRSLCFKLFRLHRLRLHCWSVPQWMWRRLSRLLCILSIRNLQLDCRQVRGQSLLPATYVAPSALRLDVQFWPLSSEGLESDSPYRLMRM